MALEVTVHKATNLLNLDKIGKSDPYVILLFQGEKKKTDYISGNLNPEWNENFIWEIGQKAPAPDEALSIWVKDYEHVGRNRLMGEATLLLRNSFESDQPVEYELKLFDHNQRETASTLFLTVAYKKPIAGKEAEHLLSDPRSNVVSNPTAESSNISLTANNALLDSALANKTKFQVRVYVLEARQLVGSNLSPICQVTFSHVSKQTQVSKGSSNPWWKETFFFSIECTGLELYKEVLEFKVQNARALRSAMVLGHFKMDIGQVYGQPRHAYVNKWLLLKNDDDESISEVVGYLKVSVAVVGPGDDIPDFDPENDDENDVESNLLLPLGTQLKPATFVLDLYQATDLPRMDPGTMEGVKRILNIDKKKDLVDPYAIISFAGNKVSSKIVYGEDHPNWNEKMFIGFQFPSVCEKIKLTLKDWDRVLEDDTIAEVEIPVPLISASGDNGFLPCFGPSWVNLYGAPREYSLLNSSNKNSCAEDSCFRGRVLLSLTTDLGNYPSARSLPLGSDDVIRSQFYCRRRRFRLHAIFLDATMVNITDAPVEFEVSIGNFGNQLEDRFLPSPSSTQPTNAVFDGCRYYYLPWKDKKPSVLVISQWEDIDFRLETLNLLKRAASRMEKLLNETSDIDVNDPEYDNASTIDALITSFLEITDFELPEPKHGGQQENELDRLLRRRRTDEIKNLRDQVVGMVKIEVTLEQVVHQLEDILLEFKNLIYEPQNSIPDVVVWMLCGRKRIAFKRIPAHEVLFSPAEDRRGIHCDQILTLMLQKSKDGKASDPELPAVVRVRFWFGLEAHEKHWREMAQSKAALNVFAETYENQVNILGTWTNKGPTMTRPSWSDSSGTVKLKPDTIAPPLGWRFSGDWFIAPEPSLKFNDDAGRKAFLEDVFENQTRLPGTSWNLTSPTWTDLRGDSSTPRDEFEPPVGWDWEDVWQVDLHRAVDEEGWEYTVESTLGGYQPVEKTYHLCRRRRWIRLRILQSGSNVMEQPEDDLRLEGDEGWEYSMLFGGRFHARKKRMDLVRRRRWHRLMESDDPVAPLVFNIDPTQTNEQTTAKSVVSCPRLSLTYNESFRMQFRAYVYQARELAAGDKTGFSDPYVCVSFLHQSQKTEVVTKTLNPTWDQTLIFQEVVIHATEEDIKQQPPSAILEMYDRDTHGDDEFLGRVLLHPLVQQSCQSFQSPSLVWHSLMQGESQVGQILASCELFFIEDSFPVEPPKRGEVFIVPSQIRPKLQLSAVEILCWGVRNMKTFELCPVNRPSIEFDCGGHSVQSKPIADVKNNPNFDDPVLYLEMMLPQEARFMPPMNLRVRDHRPFGRKPVIGTHAITRMDSYLHTIPLDIQMNGQLMQLSNDVHDGEDTIIDIEDGGDKDLLEVSDSSIDWWAKYYASTGDMSKSGQYLQLGYDPLKVFPTELEKVEPFNGFSDFLNTFLLKRGATKSLEESSLVGEFKGTFRIYPIPSDPDEPRPPRLLKSLPHSTKEDILVRVYVVRAVDLVPKDSNGKADPFVRVRLGKKEVDNRKNYKPNTLNPIFGEVFELTGTLPLNKDLTVSLWDYDLVSSDDLIGETVIDLENRYLTKYRATCGLPSSYEIQGLNKWRNSKKPTEILEDVCLLRHLPSPIFHSTTVVTIGNRRYSLEDFEYDMRENPRLGPVKQRLALHILHDMKVLPEHVETRALYNPASPDLQQGKLQMWVEIFPTSQGKPGPLVDISPRVPVSYVLRVIIWNTYEVPLDEKNVVSGDTMSDIYIKAIFADGNSQKTDVHYRSMDGEGNFNWRMIFPIDYLASENRIAIKKKKHLWSLDHTESFVPPKITFQIWDDDIFSSDDFLGSLEFALSAMPSPTKSVEKCSLMQLGLEEGEPIKLSLQLPQEKTLDLFKKKRTRGFWPCLSFKGGDGYTMAGKLEMELELLTAEEAESKPAGLGRDEPNLNPKLEQPQRPETSFLWFTSPWKSFKFVLWRKYKWYCITILLIFLALLLVVLFIYSFPESLAFRLVN